MHDIVYNVMLLLKRSVSQKDTSSNNDLNIFFLNILSCWEASNHYYYYICFQLFNLFFVMLMLYFYTWLREKKKLLLLKKRNECTTRHAKIDWMTLFETYITFTLMQSSMFKDFGATIQLSLSLYFTFIKYISKF